MKNSKEQGNNSLSKMSINSTQLNETLSAAKNELNRTNQQISNGINNPYASTGTPIDDLKGGAKFMAVLSNIGGGLKDTGGGGVEEGFDTINCNVTAKSVINTSQMIETNNNRRKGAIESKDSFINSKKKK